MWKTIGGRCIYQSPSGAKVYQNFFYRWLTFESNAIQTLIPFRKPEKLGLSYVKQLTSAILLQPADACLLGLGGAGVAHYLNASIGSFTLQTVENNNDVIHIAKTYFMANQLKHLNIIHQDANLFVKHPDTHYQHLLVDLFDAHSFPASCNNAEFFINCRQLLLPNGILAVNLANPYEQWNAFIQIRQIFHQRTIVLPVKKSSNMIVLAYNGESLAPLLDMFKKSHYLKGLSWNTRWGCVCFIS